MKMHMKLGACAHCGTRLPPYVHEDPLQKALDAYSASDKPSVFDDDFKGNGSRPYFCYDCTRGVVGEELDREYDKELARLDRESDEAVHPGPYQDLITKRWRDFRDLGRDGYFKLKSPPKYRSYFHEYYMQRGYIRDDAMKEWDRQEAARREKENAEWQKRMAAEEKEFQKAAEKRRLELLEQEAKHQEPIESIPYRIRYEHTHILAPSGSGKTTLLQQIILDDLDGIGLEEVDTPATIVIDPKGEMVRRLQRVASIAFSDRLIILDATDVRPPALNLFSIATTNPSVRRRIQNQTIDLLEYIFSSSEFSLTPKQSIGFAFLARLMFEIPRANIFTFLDVVEEEPKGTESAFAPYIQKLDEGARRFFQKDFYTEFKETKAQIKARLYMILKSPELSRIFNAPTCRVDWYDAIQKEKVILVNTGMNQLGEAASQMFGRYVIASVVAAAAGREGDKRRWSPTFLHIDEAQLFVDETKTQRMLNLSREYKLGITLAHQQMTGHPFNDNIRNSISTNTSIKYAASVEAADLNQAAKDLRCDPDFIRKQQRRDGQVNFACYIRNMNLKYPFTVSVPIGNTELHDQLTPHELSDLLDENRHLYGVSPKKALSASRSTAPPPTASPAPKRPPARPTDSDDFA